MLLNQTVAANFTHLPLSSSQCILLLHLHLFKKLDSICWFFHRCSLTIDLHI